MSLFAGGEISPLKRISSALDLHLLGDATFVHIIIGLSVVYTSSIAFSMLFPFHLRQIGFATAETASCMSALSAADITARFTIPKLARRVRIGYRTTFLFGALVLACCRAGKCKYSSHFFSSRGENVFSTFYFDNRKNL